MTLDEINKILADHQKLLDAAVEIASVKEWPFTEEVDASGAMCLTVDTENWTATVCLKDDFYDGVRSIDIPLAPLLENDAGRAAWIAGRKAEYEERERRESEEDQLRQGLEERALYLALKRKYEGA